MSKNNPDDSQELLLMALESANARILELEKALDNLQIVCSRTGADYPITQLIELRTETEKAREALKK